MADGPMGEAPTGVWATRRAWWGVLLVVWLMSAAWMGHYTFRGWIPHDEGTIGQSAERVLMGERPHEDFDDIYTGGLSYLNAAAMATFGMNLRSPRIVLAAAFLLCIPVFYYAASRFAGPLGAGLTTLVAVAWGPPVYMAALPSWYNMMLAVAALAACLRYLETEHRRWLFVAGLCAGLSFLIKVVGLYLLAALLLFLSFVQASNSRPFVREGQAAGDRSFRIASIAAIAVFVALVYRLLGRGPDPYVMLYLFPPVMAVALALILSQSRSAATVPAMSRFATLASLGWPLAVGVLIPAVIYLVPYGLAGSVDALFHGVFILPQRHLSDVAWPLPPFRFNTPLIALLLLVVYFLRFGPLARRVAVIALGLTLLLVVPLSRAFQDVYLRVWGTVRLAPTLVVLLGVIVFATRIGRTDAKSQQQLYLVLAVTALVALVQFPTGLPLYFCYIAPLLALAVLAVLRTAGYPSRAVPAILAAFYVAFGAFVITPPSIYQLATVFQLDDQTVLLDVPRGGLRVSESDARDFEQVTRLIRRHARSEFTLAIPDAPEIYFLSGLRNPTRTVFDVFADTAGRNAQLLATLERHAVSVIVINHNPAWSKPVAAELQQTFRQRYPMDSVIGRFEVRWRH